ncbi:dihydrofolate reductase family protein [Proteus vulgaris]|uniref:dihydrofolate reductase family protein n=1 Tax=Proteus vulgaris TaxID=585 RepID=UPI0018CCD825|nr:dihydrofolate reductase family protein [Proteus vulgaris]QPN89290.1 dihydrofolate reductase [Proteus vulgaris]
MNIVVYIATSLDGYIADKQGNIDWLTDIENPENSDFGFADFLNEIDAIVMGRTTFETIMSFDIDWPYTQPVFVLSHTLKRLSTSLPDNVEIMSGNVSEIIQRLNQNNYKRVYIDGGKTVQGFIDEGFVDELIITKIPILLGCGVPLFIPNNNKIEFVHYKTEIYRDSLVKSHYKRK